MAGGLPAPVLSDFYDGLPVSAPTTEHQQTAATPFYKNNGYTHFELYIKGNIHPGRIAYIFKFGLTWSPFTYSMTLDAYHIDSVNTCYD